MLSALAGKTCEDMEENFESKPSYSGLNPVLS
jgi:hypothetical protein